MNECVLDASVVLKWIRSDEESLAPQARAIEKAFSAGRLHVVVPHLLFLEIVNAAARRWRWERDALVALAQRLPRIGFEVGEAPLEDTARWAAAGLTAYDAEYVALAEARGVPLITADRKIIAAAAGVAQPLADQAG